MKRSFCPNCGKSVRRRENRYSCSKCGFEYFQNPAPCTAAILLNQKDEILFVKRAIHPKKGWLDFPGGFIEPGETAEHGIRRELQQEVGKQPQRLQYLGSYPDRYRYGGETIHTLVAMFVGRMNERGVRPADDVAEITFVRPKDVAWKRFAFGTMQQALKDALRKRI